jgi:hypothetical protein
MLKGITLVAAIFLERLVGAAKSSDEHNLWPETQMQDITGLVRGKVNKQVTNRD